MDKNISKLLLLQINDTLFPIGSYSHSFGLETYIQKEIITNKEKSFEYIKSQLNQTLCYSELLPIRICYEYAKKNEMNSILELDEIISASIIPKEIKKASEKLGSRFIKTVEQFDLDYNNNLFSDYVEMKKGQVVHHVIVYSLFCFSNNIDIIYALQHYLYSKISNMVTTLVKTVPLSQTVGQKLLFSSFSLFEDIIIKVFELSEDDIGLSCPAFDLRCMQHERLYSRLYMS